jgi:methyl-accepting chemotaxis protein
MGLVNLGRLGSDTQFTRRLLLLSLTSFALLILAGAAAIHMAGRSAEAESRIVHTLDVRKEARALMVDLLDGETSVRGFVLTQDERFLEPLKRADTHLRRPVDQLLALTADNPAQQRRLQALKPKVEAGLSSSTRHWR